MIRFLIPGLRLVSEANAHGYWRERHARSQAQRTAAKLTTAASLAGDRPAERLSTEPLVVTIVRIAPGRCWLDSDNLVGSAKHVRDGVADALGVNDRDTRVTWHVEQRKGAGTEHAVEVTIAARETCPHCGAVVRERGAA